MKILSLPTFLALYIMRTPEFYAAVYGIVKNPEGKILFQRRANSGFNDGILQLPSGHIEWEESYFEALQREMLEEIGIELQESDVKLCHILHRVNRGNRVYFDIFFEIQNYIWNIQNKEPHKCTELDFFDLSHPDITPYNILVIEEIKKWNMSTEVFHTL